MTVNARLIRSGRYEEIGLIVRRDTSLLIERWAKRAVEEQPNAQRAHHDVILDHLPSFLHEMGIHLATAGDADGYPHCRPAVKHGDQRWEVGWSLAEVIRDYRILRLVVLAHLDECLDRPLELVEIQAVGLALDEAIEASVAQYVGNRDEETQKLQTALVEADRRKDEFLATLAHELRNPLAPLRNSLELIRLSGDSPETFQEAREIMERQVGQMSRLLEDLLDVSRIARGGLALHKERIDLRSVLDQAVQMSTPLRQDHAHRLTLTVPPEPLWVEGDSTRLVQVLVNLLNNAALYTPKGGAITVEADQTEAEVIVRVKDTGVGIPPDKLDRIFEMFTQLSVPTQRPSRGLGIGLSLVRRLIELHGGRIRAQSDGVGKGSQFELHLPAVPVQPKPSEAEPERSPNEAQHILIVEDNRDGRESLARLLTKLGHRVDMAEDGATGVQAATTLRPRAVLIDIGLPEMDGFEVARQIRAALGEAVLLIAVTGHSQPDDRGRCVAAGFNAHLIKPLELKALQRLLTSGRTS